MDRVIRWGIIGCGDVCQVKSGPAFANFEGSTIWAVQRRTPGAAKAYAEKFGVPRYYEDANDLVSDPHVDAVYVATPPGSHLDLGLLVAKAGKPCYMEKPLARNYPESQLLVDAFIAAKVPLYCAYYRRALPRWQQVAALLHAGTIGTPTCVEYRYGTPAHLKYRSKPLPWRLCSDQSGGGLLLDVGCHVLDLLDFLFGPMRDVTGHATRLSTAEYDVEDRVVMTATLDSRRVTLAASWNFTCYTHEDVLSITGTLGRISLAGVGTADPIRVQVGDKAEVHELKIDTPKHVQQPLIELVVADICAGAKVTAGDGCLKSPLSNGESALRTAAVLDTVLCSFYGWRNDAFWARPTTWPSAVG